MDGPRCLADAGVPVVLNALDNLPGSFDGLGARLDNAALLHEAGVTVLFTSGETHNARKLRQVVGNAIAQGFPYESAMAAMTSLPAEIFGGRPRMVAPGLAADLVIWAEIHLTLIAPPIRLFWMVNWTP